MCRTEDLVSRVYELGQNAVAITDHGTMYGTIEFYKACKEFTIKDAEGKEIPHPIKPIIGLETYVVPDMLAHVKLKEQIEQNKKARKQMTEKQKKADDSSVSIKEAFINLATEDETYFGNSVAVMESDEEGNLSTSYRFANAHLLLLAKNEEGYKNLINIATESQLTGFYSKPRIDMNYLRTHGKGIIATSACLAGEIPRMILRNRVDLAKKKIQEYCEIFDEFYLEIQPGQNAEQQFVNQTLIEISEEINVPLVATADAHYVYKEDAEVHDILLGVATGDSLVFDEKIYYIKSEQEMLEAGIPQIALDNTQRIADQCNVEISFGKTLLPKIDIPAGYDSASYIRHLCYESFMDFIRKKPGLDIDLYQKRLDYELDTIINKGLADYLLMVQDFLNWSRRNNVYVGPGRGSAVGSLACYYLGITTLDPITNDLMFERFINPDRPSFPDIDSDFEEYIEIPDDLELSQMFKSGRQSVIEYVIAKYGEDHICQIGTFGTMGSRAVLKDVGRVLSKDFPEEEHKAFQEELNQITKFVPMEAGKQWTLNDCINGNVEHGRIPVAQLVDYAQKHPRLFEIAMKLQGQPRHPSIHAAGVVICPEPVRELIPLMRGGDGEIVAQFDMSDLEELGILKMDFLGLRTLGAIHRTIDLIEKRHGIRIDTDEIDLNDPDAMALISSGFTDGVFQVESDGMKAMFRSMNRISFENITAGIALYRPGPMANIPRYVACLNGYSQPEYMFPQLESVLNDTFGVLVYQEQLMLVAKNLAGFDWVTVDGYRKAVGKKKEKLIKKMNAWLVDGHHDNGTDIPGLVATGVPRAPAQAFADDIVSFGSYAFNKSHAAGYAKVVVITAALKAKYPIEYMTPLISSFIGKDPDKVIQYINESKRMGLQILPPDVNASEFEFIVEGEAPLPSFIRYGLGAIKGLSKVAMIIYEDRVKNGRFLGIDDFLVRFGKKEMNKKALDVLVLSGTLDSLALSLKDRPITVVNSPSAKDPLETKVYGIADAQNEDGTINRMKLLEIIYALRSYGSTEGILESYCDENSIVKMKKKYAKVSNTEDTMLLLSVEHSLLGMYVTAHPLTGKAEPIAWQMLSHGTRFDVTCIIRNVRALKTRFGKPMAFVSIETLEGMKDVVVFTKEYEAYQGKLEAGGIRTFTLESQLKDGEFSYIAKNIKLAKNT